MTLSFDKVKESQNLIKKLLLSIQEATQSMNSTFQQTVHRHEQQFLKCYRLKIHQLVKLLEELKNTIQDKFINNTLAIQLQTVLKERDYFKYQCLKLNSQHQSLLDDHKNITAQSSNASEQIAIYKHLLQTEKLKSNEVEINVENLKKNISEIAFKSMPQKSKPCQQNRIPQVQREMVRLKRQIRQKNEIIRALRERSQDLQRTAILQHQQQVQKKDLFELWKVCADGWRREIQNRGRKDETRLLSMDQFSISNKKQLLRMFFSHGQFLKFLQRLLFDQSFRVVFEASEQNYMQKNRAKLVNYMNKRRIYTSQKGRRW